MLNNNRSIYASYSDKFEIKSYDNSEVRKKINDIFDKYKDKTIIFISHRLDNLDLFDNLIKIENGVGYNVCKNG